MSLAEQIKQKALELGFDQVGITGAWPIDTRQAELLRSWLKSGFAGQMSYMHPHFEKRANPAKLLENAKSVVVVALNYALPKLQAKPSDPAVPTGRVANYAQYEDYHLFIKHRLRRLAEFICSVTGAGHRFKICVDSAPLAERALAARAGLGFIGKNHMLINPIIGSQIFLGEIITDIRLRIDEPNINDCSDCDKCVDSCPTGALRLDGQFDANKCISYLTIEYRGQIPPELAERIGDRLFGCDECVLACPYQHRAPACKNKQFKFYPERGRLDLQQLLKMTQEDFEAAFADSPIKRSGLDRLKRNAQICLADSDQE